MLSLQPSLFFILIQLTVGVTAESPQWGCNAGVPVHLLDRSAQCVSISATVLMSCQQLYQMSYLILSLWCSDFCRCRSLCSSLSSVFLSSSPHLFNQLLTNRTTWRWLVIISCYLFFSSHLVFLPSLPPPDIWHHCIQLTQPVQSDIPCTFWASKGQHVGFLECRGEIGS